MAKLKIISCLILIVSILGLSVTACTSPEPASTPIQTTPVATPKTEPIIWEALKSTGGPLEGPFWTLARLSERVNERSNGELQIKILGGPEVIPSPNQAEALKTGIVDVWAGLGLFYSQILPEAEITYVTHPTYEEDEVSGFNDYFGQIHKEKMNAYLLGGTNKYDSFLLLLKNPISSLKDLKGLKFRSIGGGRNKFLEELGTTPVSILVDEAYTALEQGLVQGAINNWPGVRDFRFYEVTKYLIDHDIWGGGGCNLMINLDSWNALPSHLQDLVNEINQEMKPESFEYQKNLKESVRELLQDEGMTFIKLSPSEAEYYQQLAEDVVWELTKARVTPESYAKLEETLK